MTIVFQGHVEKIEIGPIGKLAVTLVTPMVECNGAELVVFVPASDGAHWMPGRAVSFTIYALPQKSVSAVLGEAIQAHVERSGPDHASQ